MPAIWHPARLLSPLLALWLALAAGQPAQAQGKLDARYTASLAGVPLGKGAWVIDISEGAYSAAASGTTTGLMRVFSSGQGSGTSQGAIADGLASSINYGATLSADKKSEDVRISMNAGSVKNFSITPLPPPNPGAIPLTETHRRGVTDPMAGSLVVVQGNGDVLAPEACQRKIAVFDGRMRYDLQLNYKRTDRVKAEKGYDGPALVCAVYFRPIAGYVPDRAAIKYLIKLREMELWFVPVAGTRVLVPFRFSVPTPLGLGVLEATQFVTVAVAKTQ
ncbi:MAG: DUF3108 domain-containing protein [Pseudorhodoplanes sp.]